MLQGCIRTRRRLSLGRPFSLAAVGLLVAGQLVYGQAAPPSAPRALEGENNRDINSVFGGAIQQVNALRQTMTAEFVLLWLTLESIVY